ncbi:MAG: NAD(P)H-hydrate dehydratase [bacterium]
MEWISDKVVTADMMREMDRKTIHEYGIPGIVLMENAGRGAFDFITDEFNPRKVAVFAGKGNNGGDGYVIARHLLNSGINVLTFVLASKKDIKGDAKTNLDALENMGASVVEAIDFAVLEDNRYRIQKCDLLVDAILGTGIQKEVSGYYREAIEFINGMAENYSMNVFSVDLPSGLNADTGQVMGVCVKADASATFGALKTGQLSFPGAALTGSLVLVDISMPRELYSDVPYKIVTEQAARELMPARFEDCHKGDVGRGLVLAGSPGKTGAAIMAAESAQRTGAGLITLAGPAGLHTVFESRTLEVMTEPLPDQDRGMLGEESLHRALELAEKKNAVALGPGIGRAPEVTAFVKEMIKKSPVPLVIDADGLNAVADEPQMLTEAGSDIILTPHPGEMARLTGTDTGSVLADRFGVCTKFADRYKAVVVLKGAHSLIGVPDGRARINITGNPGMASGGTGDVLTGIILGLLCQGLDPEEAAVLGTWLHGKAGDIAARELGEHGLIARDLMDKLPAAFSSLNVQK